MRDTTPYHERPEREVSRERGCMRQIFAEVPLVSCVFEAFGGVGDTALVLREQFPGIALFASDLDRQCCEVYRRRVRSPRRVFQGDAREAFSHWARDFETGPWGASLDFNKFTFRDLENPRGNWKVQLLDRVVAHRPVWVQITDSAIRYLHLNYHRYGLEISSPEGYAQAVSRRLGDRYPLRLRTWSHHFAAMYLLFALEGEDHGC